MDLELADMFGKPPGTIMKDHTLDTWLLQEIEYDTKDIATIPGRGHATGGRGMQGLAHQQSGQVGYRKDCHAAMCRSPAAPLNNLGAVALDYRGKKGYATSIGHAPVAGMVDPEAGSVLAIAEALTNMIWAPMPDADQEASPCLPTGCGPARMKEKMPGCTGRPERPVILQWPWESIFPPERTPCP